MTPAARFALTAVALALVPLPVSADALERLNRSLSVLDSRASSQYAASVRLRPDYEEGQELIPSFEGAYAGPWLAVARAAAQRHGIPEDLFLRLVQQESGWNTEALSIAGAIGLAQIMPDTAVLLGIDPHDPTANLDGGARYLALQYRNFRRWDHALAAYNAGPEAVRAHNGIPPFQETRDYVRVILGTS